jgi:hypothetical protein
MVRILSVLRRKYAVLSSGRSPGSEAASVLQGRFTFPSLFSRVAFRNDRPQSQWRDRAGFAPDFPVRPLRAPGTIQYCTTVLGLVAG